MIGLRTQRLNKSANKKAMITISLWAITILIVVLVIWSQTNLLIPYNTIYSASYMPKSLVGTRIVHISDINNTGIDFVSATKKFQPDMIILSGGYSDQSGKSERTIANVKKLVSIAPVYYVMNKGDGDKDVLQGTGATNITNKNVVFGAQDITAENFIKQTYGTEMLENASVKDSEASEYLEYIKKELEETSNAKIQLIGLGTFVSEEETDGKKALNFINNVTDDVEADFNIGVTGNAELIIETSQSQLDAMFTGGTFGTTYLSQNYTKGQYGLRGTQVFICGGLSTPKQVKRIFNFPEIQCITLSDGSIQNKNPLEKFIEKFIPDVGTIFDNDGGFREYQHTYKNGEEEKKDK